MFLGALKSLQRAIIFELLKIFLNIARGGCLAETIRNIPNMTEGGRLVPFQNISIEIGNFTAANCFQEIREVAFGLACKRPDQLSLRIKERFRSDDSFRAIKNPTCFVIRIEWIRL